MRVKKLDYGQVEYICEQLSMMIGSGIGAADGMELLCDDIPDGTLKAACMEISGAVSKGESLSAAVRSTGRFPEYAADMISVGEMSGKLEEVLRGLAEYYDERDEIRRALRSAVLHPMVLLLMMTVVMIVLVVMVIPMFGDIFSQFRERHGEEYRGACLQFRYRYNDSPAGAYRDFCGHRDNVQALKDRRIRPQAGFRSAVHSRNCGETLAVRPDKGCQH